MSDENKTTECRHEWQCEGWTVDRRTSTCRVCGKQFVFWSEPDRGWGEMNAAECGGKSDEPLLTYEQIDARDKIIAWAARDQALEDAAAECDRHAAFCKNEAHRGGDWKHLMARVEEAAYNAKRIRALKEQPQ